MTSIIEQFLQHKNPAHIRDATINNMRRDVQLIKFVHIDKSIINKYCVSPVMPNHDMSSYEIRIWQLNTVYENLLRIWNNTRDKSVLPGILFRRKLKELDEQIDYYEQTGLVSYRLTMILKNMKEYIDNYLRFYEELHSVRPDKDPLQSMMDDIEA